jgi:hypothetical protein
MSYTFTYTFEDLPVSDATVDGWAEIDYARDGSWEVSDCAAYHAFDRDDNEVAAPSSGVLRCALVALRGDDINADVAEEIAGLNPPVVERAAAQADARRP